MRSIKGEPVLGFITLIALVSEALRVEPQGAHTNRVRSMPRSGAKLKQTLLMNEGKVGTGSLAYPKPAALIHPRSPEQ